MRPLATVVLMAIAPALAAADVAVKVNAGRVDLAATAAPLGDVLDRLARQTGMKVVYEGPVPRSLVTLTIQGRTPAEAVLSVLEGQGVNFALLADSTGAGVQTLVVAGSPASTAPTSPSPAAASRPSTRPRRVFGIPPGSSPEAVETAPEDGDDGQEEAALPGAGPGAEANEPAAAPNAAGAAPKQPGAPSLPPPLATSPGFSASPFTPQPQPFPPQTAPTPAPPPEGQAPAPVPPPP